LVARDELNAFLTKTTDESNRFNEKREHHFERLIARGQEPIRIEK
jgi:acyl-[acyl-carrier-protein] desaturase